MPTELLSDKLANVESQLNQCKLQLYLAEIQATFAANAPADADEVAAAAHLNLSTEAMAARVNVISWRRKVEVYQKIYDELVAEKKARDGAPGAG